MCNMHIRRSSSNSSPSLQFNVRFKIVFYIGLCYLLLWTHNFRLLNNVPLPCELSTSLPKPTFLLLLDLPSLISWLLVPLLILRLRFAISPSITRVFLSNSQFSRPVLSSPVPVDRCQRLSRPFLGSGPFLVLLSSNLRMSSLFSILLPSLAASLPLSTSLNSLCSCLIVLMTRLQIYAPLVNLF